MPILMLLPFGVFFICCLLQFWYLKKVRDALIERHAETFLAVEKSSIFPMQGLWKFTRGNRYKALGDPDLNRHVRNLKRLMLVAYTSWAAYAASLIIAPLEPPRLLLSVANGSYANECCGKIILKDGQMTVLKQQVSYVIESDKRGAYVLPSLYVGASSQGLVVRQSSYPPKLYLDDERRPGDIELMDDTSSTVFSFRRLNEH